jgi:hypothetical protein
VAPQEPSLAAPLEALSRQYNDAANELARLRKDHEMLQRYQIVPPNNDPQPDGVAGPGDWHITQTSKDDESLGASLRALACDRQEYDISSELAILEPAMKACSEATPAINGTKRMDIEQVRAYLTTPEQEAAFQSLIQHRGGSEPSK